jgi:hypothetical protein
MSGLGALRRRLHDAQLVEWSKDDSSSWPEFGFEDLEHRNIGSVELQNPPSRTLGRIVHPLGQLDDVEFVDLSCHCHGLSMLGGRIRGHQSWRSDLNRVMPRDECQSMPSIDGKPDFDSASYAVGRPANLRDRGPRHRLGDSPPDSHHLSEINPEHTRPFATMSLFSKDPLQLALFVPDVLSAGKRGSNSGWPGHRTDARRRRRVGVRLKSILRVSNHTEAKRAR